MKAFVIIATKGRAKETYTLLDYLAKQTYPIEKIVIVGSESKDVENLEKHPLFLQENVDIKISKQAGLTIQRNVGLDVLRGITCALNPKEWFVTFFDDDFRPKENWLAESANAFTLHLSCVGLNGNVIADGVTTGSITEAQAAQYLNKYQDLNAPVMMEVFGGLYGCNMAYRGNAATAFRFDENLPLYGWQEDIDYAASVVKLGKLLSVNQCVGVHLGVTGGRTSGVRFGYSQIANPIYLAKKGTMRWQYALKIASKNVASNIMRTLTFNQKKDYRGRLVGNFKAFLDICVNKCHPTNVIKL